MHEFDDGKTSDNQILNPKSKLLLLVPAPDLRSPTCLREAGFSRVNIFAARARDVAIRRVYAPTARTFSDVVRRKFVIASALRAKGQVSPLVAMLALLGALLGFACLAHEVTCDSPGDHVSIATVSRSKVAAIVVQVGPDHTPATSSSGQTAWRVSIPQVVSVYTDFLQRAVLQTWGRNSSIAHRATVVLLI